VFVGDAGLCDSSHSIRVAVVVDIEGSVVRAETRTWQQLGEEGHQR